MPIPPGTPGRIHDRPVAIPVWVNDWKDPRLMAANLSWVAVVSVQGGFGPVTAPYSDAAPLCISLLPSLASAESLHVVRRVE